MKQWTIQLRDHVTGEAIVAAGGVAYVATAGAFAKVALLDASGASASNPSVLTRGQVEFFTSDDVTSVDLYIASPSGHFVVAKTVLPSGPNELSVDKTVNVSMWQIPFAIGDTTAAVETDTGFDLPENAQVLPAGAGVHVGVLDAGETVDVGILAGEAGGDANGFMALVSVAALGMIPAQAVVTTGGTETYYASQTLGALIVDFLAGADVATDVGVNHPKAHPGDGTAESITYTLTAGTDLAEGIILLPVVPAIA